jgi:SAM-dependent methyltransferase
LETTADTRGPAPAQELTSPACGAELDETPAIEGPDRLHGVPGRFGIAIYARCGSGLALPVVPEQELNAYYPHEYPPYEAASGRLQSLVYATIRRWQAWRGLRSSPLRTPRDETATAALDVGCGRGDLGAALIERGWQVTEAEPSAEACEVARGRGVDARVGTLTSLKLEPGAYGAVVFQHSLEHVPGPAASLAAAWRALRPGGVVIVSIPNFGSWQRRRFRSTWFHLDLPRHRTHFTREGLANALRRAGFDIEQLSTSTSAVGLPASVQYAVARRSLFRGGLRFRLSAGACSAVYPVARISDRLGGDGDVLNAVARRETPAP